MGDGTVTGDRGNHPLWVARVGSGDVVCHPIGGVVTPGDHGLSGRHRELTELRRVIDLAASGSGQALVLVGDTGIGKSTLLDTVATMVPVGSVVVTMRAVEAESHLAYAAAIDLLGPLMAAHAPLGLDGIDGIDGLSGEAMRVLEALMTAQPGAAGPMPLCRAAFGAVVGASAGVRLVVLVVDDAQWLDQASAEMLLYIARRIGDEPVAIVAAVRAGATSPLLSADLAQMHIDGLSVAEMDHLLAPHQVVPSVAVSLYEATAGNPLAVLEIVRGLSPSERAAASALPPFPPVGAAITEAFGKRISALATDEREAMVVVAAHGSGHVGVLHAALRALGHEPDVLTAPEIHELISVTSDSVTFVHPLVRLVVYSSATPALRRTVHSTLADAWWPEQPIRGAWHLGESATGPNEAIAASLETVATNARSHNAAMVAAELFKRAGDLSMESRGRERRWLTAAQCFTDAARPSTVATIARSIVAVTSDPLMHADATFLLGSQMTFAGPPLDACELLRAEAALIGQHDPQRAVLLLAAAYTAALLAIDFKIAGDIASDAQLLAGETGPIGVLATNALQMQTALIGGQSAVAQVLLAPIEQLASMLAANGVAEADYLLQNVALAYLILDRWQEAHTMVSAVIRRARAAGKDATLAFAYAVGSEAALRMGHWPSAYVDARRAGDHYDDPDDRSWATLSSLALSARVEAHLGMVDECRDHANTVVDSASRLGSTVLVVWARHALGLLALSLHDHREAIHQLEFIADVMEQSGVHDPGYLWWSGDLIEAYWRSNRLAEAVRVRATLEADAHLTGRLSALMIVARADALLGPSERAEQSFARSIALGEQVGARFEVARTQMLYAEWQKANGADASDGLLTQTLHSALTTFERLGAKVWATRCRALGQHHNTPPSISPTLLLGDRELEVAMLAARGLSNREIADELFLSPKTVENTLGKVFRKLAVRSRTQLAIVVLSAAPQGRSV